MPNALAALQILGGGTPAGGQQGSSATPDAFGSPINIGADSSKTSRETAPDTSTSHKEVASGGSSSQRALAILSGDLKIDSKSMPSEGEIDTNADGKSASYERGAGIEDLGAMSAFNRKAGNMMTFGLSKPFNAAVGAGVIDPVIGMFSDDPQYHGDFGDRYKAHMDFQQGLEETQDALHPVASTAGTVTGAVASLGTGAPVKAATTAAVAKPSVVKLIAKNTAINAGTGAAIGGLNAAGYADEKHLEAGLEGAQTGALLGATVPPVFQALFKTPTGRRIAGTLVGAGIGYAAAGKEGAYYGAGAGLVAPALISRYIASHSPAKIEEQALKKIAEAFGRDNVTPDEALHLLGQTGAKAGIVDTAGENVRGLGRAVSGAPGEAKDVAKQFLNARQSGQGVRVESAMTSRMGATHNYYSVDDALSAQQKAAGPLYDEAYKANQSVMTPALNRMLRTPAGQKALAEARVKMQNDMTLLGVPDKELTEQARLTGQPVKNGVAAGLKLRTHDYIKRAMDDMIGVAKKGGERDNARILSDLKNAYLKELDAADVTAIKNAKGEITTPGKYKQGRAAFAGPAQARDALESGRMFINEDAEMTARQMADLTDSEKEMFRIGAARALIDKIKSTPFGSDATKNIFGNAEELFGSAAKRDRMKVLFPTPEAFDAFEQQMLAEARMYTSRAQVLHGSRTTPMAAEMEDAGIDAAPMLDAATGNIKGALLQKGLDALAKLKMPEPVRNFIAQRLFTEDQAVNAQTLQQLQHLIDQQAQQPALNIMPAIAGQTGQGAGLLTAH